MQVSEARALPGLFSGVEESQNISSIFTDHSGVFKMEAN
jgi:hypothetical protein